MSSKRIYDLTVKSGEYTNNQGETKGRYVNVGAMMERDDGGRYLFINRTVNFAGFPNPDNRDNIIVSMFEVKDNNSGQQHGNNHQQSQESNTPKQTLTPPSSNRDEEDIPF